MRCKDKARYILWIVAPFLLTALASGCGNASKRVHVILPDNSDNTEYESLARDIGRVIVSAMYVYIDAKDGRYKILGDSPLVMAQWMNKQQGDSVDVGFSDVSAYSCVMNGAASFDFNSTVTYDSPDRTNLSLIFIMDTGSLMYRQCTDNRDDIDIPLSSGTVTYSRENTLSDGSPVSVKDTVFMTMYGKNQNEASFNMNAELQEWTSGDYWGVEKKYALYMGSIYYGDHDIYYSNVSSPSGSLEKFYMYTVLGCSGVTNVQNCYVKITIQTTEGTESGEAVETASFGIVTYAGNTGHTDIISLDSIEDIGAFNFTVEDIGLQVNFEYESDYSGSGTIRDSTGNALLMAEWSDPGSITMVFPQSGLTETYMPVKDL